MTLRINDTIPDLTVETDLGRFSLHDWIGDDWVVFFSHPADYTPVCTTELGYTAKLKDEFAKRGAKAIALSVDPIADHHGWVKDIEETLDAFSSIRERLQNGTYKRLSAAVAAAMGE